MDIAFGMVADRVADGYRKLAHLLLWLTTVSAGAFLLLPMLASVSPGLLLAVLAIWVISASVVRAPTLVLLSKRAKAAQQGRQQQVALQVVRHLGAELAGRCLCLAASLW